MGDTNNRNNDVEQLIREALGNPDGCKIDYDIEEDERGEKFDFCIIGPKDGQETLQINSIDIAKINHLNLQFDKCIFKNEISFHKKVESIINFTDCCFGKIVDFSNAKFENLIVFEKSTFEQIVYFRKVIFNDVANFSKTTFKQKALFHESIFNKKAIFNDVEFGDKGKGYVSFSDTDFKNKAEFSRVRFQYETDFQASHFEDVLDFDDSVFMDKVDFQTANFCKRVTFNNATFQSKAGSQDSDLKTQILFSNAIFDDNVEFEDAKFLQEVFFEKTQFKKDASFSNSTFQKANFSQSKFYQNADFYGVTFKNLPNFIQAIFNEKINFINAELDFRFDGAKNEIEETYNKRKEEAKKHKIANEFRDSFRNIKSELIKDNNMLDASKYHRIELYCKELELEYRREEKVEGSGIRDIVDRIQLYCYRLTSDHHTDLLLILNNVIILIACFGIISSVANLLNWNYFEMDIFKIKQTIIALIICPIFAILAICLILGCCRDLLAHAIGNIWLFLLKALFCKEQHATTCTRTYVVFFSYIIATIILVVNPALLVPIFGQMIDLKSSIGFAFVSLNIIYAILMFLLVFSLQKTARKNTIVPS